MGKWLDYYKVSLSFSHINEPSPPCPCTLLQLYGGFIVGVHDCPEFGVQASIAQGEVGDWKLLKLFG